MKKLKWYWHIHHGILCEPLVGTLKERKEYIKKNKPEHEVKLRLKLIKKVKGEMPKGVVKAGEAYYKLVNNSRKLKALHKKECGCKWDGKSIFGG